MHATGAPSGLVMIEGGSRVVGEARGGAQKLGHLEGRRSKVHGKKVRQGAASAAEMRGQETQGCNGMGIR